MRCGLNGQLVPSLRVSQDLCSVYTESEIDAVVADGVDFGYHDWGISIACLDVERIEAKDVS